MMKAAIQGARGSVAAQETAVIASSQAITNAKNSYGTLEIAYEKAQHDLTNATASANALIKLKESAYAQAQANVKTKTQPVRSVDLEPLRAALNAASVAYDMTILRSPTAGTVSRVDGKVGGMALPNVPLVSVINVHALQADLLLPETDVSKVKVGNPVSVTIDAYGTDTTFDATVVKVDPASKTVNGQTGYTVTIQFTKEDERIKPGMTANADIVTAEKTDVVAVPVQSVIQRDGKTYVLEDGESGKPKEVEIGVGIRSGDGFWEVTSGLNAGDRIIQF